MIHYTIKLHLVNKASKYTFKSKNVRKSISNMYIVFKVMTYPMFALIFKIIFDNDMCAVTQYTVMVPLPISFLELYFLQA